MVFGFNSQILAKLEQLEKQEQFHRQTLADILTFSTRLTRNSDLKTLYRESNALAKSILKLDYSTLMILSDDGGSLVVRDAIGFPASMIDTFSLLEGQGLSTYVVREKKAAMVPDFRVEKRFEVPPVVFTEDITSALAVPMLIMDEVFGVMIGHTNEKNDFTADEINLYQSIANQTAVAIKNVMHYESLQDSEKRFRTLINRAGDAIFLADMDGRLVDVNETACRSLGYSREELLNLRVFDVDSGAGTGGHDINLWPKLSTDSYVTINTEHRRKDGSALPVEVRIGLLPLHNETYILGYARDITERLEAEKEKEKLRMQLNQAQKMESIGTLAGGIAHDFNNILTPIMGYVELALIDAADNPLLINDLKEVRNAAERAREMVQQILAFSRSDNEGVSPLQVDVVVKEALKLLRVSIPKTIEIKQDIDSSCGPVLANPTQIHQVLMNLCTNSYHAMRETGGVLEISLRPVEFSAQDPRRNGNLQPGSSLELVVRDNGCGMEQDILERIFEPYFTTKSVDEGTGMGLAVVHGIVTRIGGQIEIDSRPGNGTCVKVHLPVITESTAFAEKQSAAVVPGGTERILFVDDEQTIGNVIAGILKNHGYAVEIFTEPTEALLAFSSRPDEFDLVVTDMTMPKMTGDKLARNVMAVRPGMPVILCTGFSDLIDRDTALAMGISAYVEKPFSIDSFASTIREVLDRR